MAPRSAWWRPSSFREAATTTDLFSPRPARSNHRPSRTREDTPACRSLPPSGTLPSRCSSVRTRAHASTRNPKLGIRGRTRTTDRAGRARREESAFMTKSGKSPTRHGLQRDTHGSACGRVGLPLVVRFAASRGGEEGRGVSQQKARVSVAHLATSVFGASGRDVHFGQVGPRPNERSSVDSLVSNAFWGVDRMRRRVLVQCAKTLVPFASHAATGLATGYARAQECAILPSVPQASRALDLPLSARRICASWISRRIPGKQTRERTLGEVDTGEKAKSCGDRTTTGKPDGLVVPALSSPWPVGAPSSLTATAHPRRGLQRDCATGRRGPRKGDMVWRCPAR